MSCKRVYALSDDNKVLYNTHSYDNPKKKKRYDHMEVTEYHVFLRKDSEQV